MRSNLQERVDGVKLAAAERTFRRYGLSDLFRAHHIPQSAPGFYNKAVGAGKRVGEFLRDMYFGSPITFLEDIQRRRKGTGSTLKALGNYYKDWYLSPGTDPFVKAISIGLPAAGLISTIATGDPKTRGEDIAGEVAGLATSPVTLRFGLPGARVGDALRDVVKRAVRSPVPEATKFETHPTLGTPLTDETG